MDHNVQQCKPNALSFEAKYLNSNSSRTIYACMEAIPQKTESLNNKL